jgi:hypothetical protein
VGSNPAAPTSFSKPHRFKGLRTNPEDPTKNIRPGSATARQPSLGINDKVALMQRPAALSILPGVAQQSVSSRPLLLALFPERD